MTISSTKISTRLFLALLLPIQSIAQKAPTPLTIGTAIQLKSEILNETRTINIYIPEDYSPNDTISYPVIYIPDGGMEEDFIHIAGLVRFNTQPWIARFPKSIVVGIENTNRRRDFTHAVANLDFLEREGFAKESFPKYGESEKYIGFIEKEVIPYIENTFMGTGRKTIIGESLAGLLVTEILVRHSNLFDDYIIVSPSLWWGEQLLTKEVERMPAEAMSSEVRVYIGAPNMDEDVKMYNAAEELYVALKCKSTLSVYFDYLPEELHSTAMHQAVYNAFKILYPATAYSK